MRLLELLHLTITRTWIFAFLCLSGFGAHATTYYVSSASGSDTNNGTSQATPWKTIDRVNQAAFTYVPGDQVLFERGGTYRGQVLLALSGSAAQPLTVGAYGSGAKPLIKGSRVITGWTQFSGNIWRTSVAERVDQVYVGGARMTLARYPNTGWLRNSQGSDFTMMSTGLTQPDGYWNGARCVLRGMASVVDTLYISNYASSTLTFSTIATNHGMGTDDWGFFMCNKLSELDMAGEWYYDKAAQQLYLWAPNNADPNTITVEASVYDAGVYCGYNTHYLRIQDCHFRDQRLAGVQSEGMSQSVVTGCTFDHSFHAIRSGGGGNNTFSSNIMHDIFASGVLLIEPGSILENNTMTAISMIIGEGETSWGYTGIRILSSDCIVRGNVLDSIGYTGIEAGQNTLVEKNVIKHANATLNDGGGIAIDHADGLIMQDNLILDPIGGLDGSSTVMPHYQHLGVGIYFGNTSIKNTIVRRNTIANCLTTGIHIDHNMTSSGIQVKNNVLFNNKVGITISDYSNNNGTDAVAPFYVPNFDDVYSGNVVYCLSKDQLCLRFYMCYGMQYVDFGTFTNNRYFNPYNEMSIFVYNFAAGQNYFTLERWQARQNDEVGSTRSPLRLSGLTTTSELSGNMITSGNFDNNVTGWGGWPTNAQATHDVAHLDNGCLKAYLPDNTVYPSFSLRNPEWFNVQQGEWYRMRISLQSNTEGDVLASFKGQSQLNNPYTLGEQQVPFSTERRDLEIYLQSSLTDLAQLMFVNQWTEPMYYLDNVDVRHVQVQALDPLDKQQLFFNEQATAQTIDLTGCWSDVNGGLHSGQLTLQPYSSMVLVHEDDALCTLTTGIDNATIINSGGTVYPNPAHAGSHVNFTRPVAGTITLIAANGQVSLLRILPIAVSGMDLPSNMPTGVYALRIADQGTVHTERVVIE